EVRARLQAILHTPSPVPMMQFTYTASIETAIAQLVAHIQSHTNLSAKYPPRWLAIKLLEEDPQIEAEVRRGQHYDDLLLLVANCKAAIEAETGEFAEILITDERYMRINQIVDHALTHTRTQQETWTDRIDAVVTHRSFGIPIFLL